jgi:hypothetical protein
VEIELKHGTQHFEQFGELMFSMFGKEIMKDLGIYLLYYGKEIEKLKKTDMT